MAWSGWVMASRIMASRQASLAGRMACVSSPPGGILEFRAVDEVLDIPW